ncbi:MAG: NapC/NirT family cytochrome c [Bdellovibrionales bacterium]
MREWRKSAIIIFFGLTAGVPAGVSTATFVTANGFSYFSSNSQACVNCHIMRDNFESWTASSHHAFTSCNDCHTHGSFISKYSQKALNGFLHSWAFTTGDFHEPIRIKEFNRKIAVQNCLRCHSQMIESSQFGHAGFGKNNCMSCHQNVGHRKW